jgi:hypothetical protein
VSVDHTSRRSSASNSLDRGGEKAVHAMQVGPRAEVALLIKEFAERGEHQPQFHCRELSKPADFPQDTLHDSLVLFGFKRTG